jgi:hypothetical protein
MAWFVMAIGLGGAMLLLHNTLSLQRRRAAAFGPSPWAGVIVASRLFLVLPFLALAVSGGRWPGLTLLGLWFALAALFMLLADAGDRLHLLRRLKAGRFPALTSVETPDTMKPSAAIQRPPPDPAGPEGPGKKGKTC